MFPHHAVNLIPTDIQTLGLTHYIKFENIPLKSYTIIKLKKIMHLKVPCIRFMIIYCGKWNSIYVARFITVYKHFHIVIVVFLCG